MKKIRKGGVELLTASFKNPKTHKLIYGTYLKEKDVPKEITRKGKVYFLYGIH
jgi:hypothetical protein